MQIHHHLSPITIVVSSFLLSSSVCSSASTQHQHQHYTSRRNLFINQEESAKKVTEVIAKAIKSTHSGVALPLGYVFLDGVGTQQLVVSLRLPGIEEDQHLLVDTGSSASAFCNSDLPPNTGVNLVTTDAVQCYLYGFEEGTCQGNNEKLGSHGWAGSLYEGNLSANVNDDIIVTIPNAMFAIMEKSVKGYTCEPPLNGIFGVAYSGINEAFIVPQSQQSSFSAADLLDEICPDPDDPSSSLLQCNTDNFTSTFVPSVLEKALNESEGIDAFGLYCDYAATVTAGHVQNMDSEVSQTPPIIPGLGAFFGGELAINNDFYDRGTPHIAKASPELGTGAGSRSWFGLILQSIRAPLLNLTLDYDASKCAKELSCFTDSGTSWLVLPIPNQYCESLKDGIFSRDEQIHNSLYIYLESADGGTIKLSIPLIWLAEQYAEGWVLCSPDESFILGLPIFQYYYLVYSYTNNTVTFVDLQLSDTDEDFIDGPSLGGMKSSGYSMCYGGSILMRVILLCSALTLALMITI